MVLIANAITLISVVPLTSSCIAFFFHLRVEVDDGGCAVVADDTVEISGSFRFLELIDDAGGAVEVDAVERVGTVDDVDPVDGAVKRVIDGADDAVEKVGAVAAGCAVERTKAFED